MPYENTLALLISVRKYMDKSDDIEDVKRFVDMLVASMADEKKIEEIAANFAKMMYNVEKQNSEKKD
nr:unnamed protein product [uncultured bacterium]